MTCISQHRTAEIEDHLGPSASRFFGAGYRRVSYQVSEPVLGPAGDLLAEASIGYPEDWSRKAEAVDLAPHLSTIDALLLGLRVSEALLTGHLGLTPAQVRAARLRLVQIKAPTRPYQDELDRVPLTARLIRTDPDGPLRRTVVDVVVGTMKVRTGIEHGGAEAEPGSAGPTGAEAVRSAGAGADRRLYGDGYRRRWQRIDQLDLDPAGLRATARLTLEGEHPVDGLGGADEPAVSFLDSFVATLQLGQVLLYRLDDIDRRDSATLWMRHTTITDESASRRTGASGAITAWLEAPALLSSGTVWRTATVVGECQGVRTRCAVTHELRSSAGGQA